MREHLSKDGAIGLLAMPGLSVLLYRRKAGAAHVPALQAYSHDPILGPSWLQLLLLVPDSVKDVPDDDFRQAAAAALKSELTRPLASAAVIPRQGFVGATTRAIMTGLTFVTRGEREMQIFSSVDEAAVWLVQQGPAAGLSATAVVDAVTGLEQRLLAMTPSSSSSSS